MFLNLGGGGSKKINLYVQGIMSHSLVFAMNFKYDGLRSLV